MRVKLTKRVIDKAIAAGAEAKLWDSAQRGLCLRVRAGSGRAYWGVEYRSNGRKVWETIGGFGETIEVNGRPVPLTVENARREAGRRRALDTAGAKRVERASDPTLSEAADRWLRQHVNEHRASSTAVQYAWLMHRHVLPWVGSKLVSEITEGDCRDLHYKLGKHGHRLANNALAVLASLLSWLGREPNPARRKIVRRYEERRRRRFFSGDELAAIGAAIKTLEADEALSPTEAAFFRALALTGCRPGELLALTWDRVNLDAGRIDLGKTKGGAADPRGEAGLVITPPLREILDRLPRDGDHVFHAYKYNITWKLIATKAGLTGPDVVPYALRHTFGTTAGMTMPLRVVSGLLGHAQVATTQRYSHVAEGPIEQAAKRVAKTMAAALDAKAAK